jgi:nucleoside-diphosphate-sugar epimerase
MQWQDNSVLITGATGFIGGRLAQRLAEETDATVTGVGRNLRAVPFLADAGVRLEQADLLDFRRMRQLLQGQDIVYHVAAWVGPRHGDSHMAWALNVYVTTKLVEMAAEAGVTRLVYVSSMAAYGAPQARRIDESHPLALHDSAPYGRTKAQGETEGRRRAKKLGLEFVTIRPGMVYGPRSYGWSLRVVRLIQRGVPVIFGDGAGHAQPVYVDNLVDALLLAATKPAVAGETYNVVDQPLAWRDWFGRYGEMCGRKPRSLPLWLAQMGLNIARYLPTGLSVDRDLVTFYTSQAVYPTTKAEQELGYRAAIGLDEGMRRTEQWLRQEGHL